MVLKVPVFLYKLLVRECSLLGSEVWTVDPETLGDGKGQRSKGLRCPFVYGLRSSGRGDWNGEEVRVRGSGTSSEESGWGTNRVVRS